MFQAYMPCQKSPLDFIPLIQVFARVWERLLRLGSGTFREVNGVLRDGRVSCYNARPNGST